MRAAVLLVVAACYSPTPPAGAPCGPNDTCPSGLSCNNGFCGGDATEIDGAVVPPDETIVDMVPLCATWTAQHFEPCTLPMPVGDLNLVEALSPYEWDTDDGTLTGRMNTPVPVTTTVLAQTDGPDVMLASVENFTMAANTELNVRGSRPLLIAVWDSATIAGQIDVSGSFSTPGPGGSGTPSTWCGGSQTGDSGTAGMPATGGGGGALQGDGGNGGNTTTGGGNDATLTATIRGGCGGGAGGASTSASSASRGGGGGGIQISARVSVILAGEIDAGGGAGTGGRAPYGGGGGGGAGGYIGIDTQSLTITGRLVANGGGGGGGASESTNGANGNISTSGNAASGGAGATTSTIGTCIKGGNGSSISSLAGQDAAASPCGGGGGGGGAGYILIWATDVTETSGSIVSPPYLVGP